MQHFLTAMLFAVVAPHDCPAYSIHGQLTNEVQNGFAIARTYDSLNRPTGYTIMQNAECGMQNDGANPSTVTYSYDTHGRFASVTALGGTRFVASANPSTTFTYAYDHRGRMGTKTLCASAHTTLYEQPTTFHLEERKHE